MERRSVDAHGQPQSISAQIERASQAIDELANSSSSRSNTTQRLTALTGTGVGIVWVLAVVALVVHTFFEHDTPKIDTTTVALLAVILFAPFVPKLKAIELGGARAEMHTETFTDLQSIPEVLKLQQIAIRRIFDQIKDEVESESHAVGDSPDGSQAGRPTILWVDDHPANNEFERESLGTDYDFQIATNNDEADRIIRSGRIDIVITDYKRDNEVGVPIAAGQRLLELIKGSPATANIPVIVYTSEKTIKAHNSELVAAGAAAVTSHFSGIVKALTKLAIGS
ncbi:hypothetical protein MYK68_13530 [Gordonia sp. PP30]|uniref:response regulator n=1 Tax=Gordonia sp. PP30 TaxID=2935861 RepID=UPI001FFE39DD|nr:hypothetical protein [Gordonia sp. PP30]UQE73757.1 hypothetical protein MYK68_13530 [Gordonia sp. PP30]